MLLSSPTTKLPAPTSKEPYPLHRPCPLSVPIPTQPRGFSKISSNVFTVLQIPPSPLSISPAQRPSSCHVPPLWQPAVGFLHSQLGILGACYQQSQLTPAAQKSEEQARWSHCHTSGDTRISSHILPVPSAAPALSGDNVPAAML